MSRIAKQPVNIPESCRWFNGLEPLGVGPKMETPAVLVRTFTGSGSNSVLSSSGDMTALNSSTLASTKPGVIQHPRYRRSLVAQASR